MNEQELRAIVRAAVARHLHTEAPCPPIAQAPALASAPQVMVPVRPVSPQVMSSSHALYVGLVNVSGECVIEPAVSCDHCGYCKSHGF